MTHQGDLLARLSEVGDSISLAGPDGHTVEVIYTERRPGHPVVHAPHGTWICSCGIRQKWPVPRRLVQAVGGAQQHLAWARRRT